MNYIKQLQYDKEALQATIDCLKKEIEAFKAHLSGEKFQGTEPIARLCPHCNRVTAKDERKDWIATADVWERIRMMEQWL